MPRLDELSEAQRKNLLGHNCLEHDTAPWTPLARPLREARLALVTTAGLHVRGDAPFTGGLQRDVNVVFPLDRMAELVAAGELGSLAATNYSFLGAQRAYDGIIDESGPEVARRLKADGVDVVFL